jgi:hypothetical protein
MLQPKAACKKEAAGKNKNKKIILNYFILNILNYFILNIKCTDFFDLI